MWAPLLAIVQAGIAGLEGLETLEQAQQQLADDLHKVCPAPTPGPALPYPAAVSLPWPCYSFGGVRSLGDNTACVALGALGLCFRACRG